MSDSLREHLADLEAAGELIELAPELSLQVEAAAALHSLAGQTVRFQGFRENPRPAVGNVIASRATFARAIGVEVGGVTEAIAAALDAPGEPTLVSKGACQEVVLEGDDVDVAALPIFTHAADDGGPYVTAGVYVARDAELGHNLSYHRSLVIGPRSFALRILDRDLMHFLKRAGGSLPVAMLLGLPPSLLLAAAISLGPGRSEYGVAAALAGLALCPSRIDRELLVPASAEWVLEGRISLAETHAEGPFVDLTETRDIVRQGPVFRVERITSRRDPIYHALLSGGLEHKLLMGLPREPTILREVRAVCDCRAVHITPGGASWLHAVVQIAKREEADVRAAIDAAFRGHSSLKHVFVVDADVDPFDPQALEWSMATRFQADRDLYLFPGQRGSSLDPSADPNTRVTCKAGFDLTIPAGKERWKFERFQFPAIDVAALRRGSG